VTGHAEDEASDAALLERAKAGDPLAFRALVERHEPAVAATTIGMLGAGPDAEDVGQETFVRFYRSLDRFRGDAALRTYLTRIAMNLALNAIRRRTRFTARFLRLDPGTPGHEPATGEPDPAGARDRRRQVRAALDALDPRHRAVVVLRLIEGYSTRETAAILDVPEGTVLSRLSRARKRLADHLRPWMGLDG
jgi:RNA polymerase sigma-70 factor (ECF subfamily)